MPKTHCLRGHLLSEDNIRTYKHHGGWKNRVCKKCLAITGRNWRLKNPNYSRDWKDKHPGWYKPSIYRKYRLKKTYGIDVNEYEKLFKKQNGKCAICEGKPGGRWNTFMIDHNHSTGFIRGLLCLKCNRAIGLIKDDIQIAKKIIKYLKVKSPS